MKKLMAVVLSLVCILWLVGCSQEKQFENMEWLDGIGFSELAPNTEIKSSSEITITEENAKLAYIITYGEADLTLEFGLVATNGKEYVKQIVGGSDYGFIENIPAGTYYLIVRNSGDYTSFTSYQDGSMSYSATGAINYSIE